MRHISNVVARNRKVKALVGIAAPDGAFSSPPCSGIALNLFDNILGSKQKLRSQSCHNFVFELQLTQCTILLVQNKRASQYIIK